MGGIGRLVGAFSLCYCRVSASRIAAMSDSAESALIVATARPRSVSEGRTLGPACLVDIRGPRRRGG
jgi:hypothetical protein